MKQLDYHASAEALACCLTQLAVAGLGIGNSGNASIRIEPENGDDIEGMLISPTGYAFSEIETSDLVFVDIDGEWDRSALQPSSEWLFHLAVYSAFPEAKAIVHCHSKEATALACLRESIPSFHYMVSAAGGSDIRCADYATFGTEALANNVVDALKDRTACLMANHGQLAYADTPDNALQLALQVEDLASMYNRAKSIGKPVLLNDKEMQEVIERFKTYGKQTAP